MKISFLPSIRLQFMLCVCVFARPLSPDAELQFQLPLILAILLIGFPLSLFARPLSPDADLRFQLPLILAILLIGFPLSLFARPAVSGSHPGNPANWVSSLSIARPAVSGSHPGDPANWVPLSLFARPAVARPWAPVLILAILLIGFPLSLFARPAVSGSHPGDPANWVSSLSICQARCLRFSSWRSC